MKNPKFESNPPGEALLKGFCFLVFITCLLGYVFGGAV